MFQHTKTFWTTVLLALWTQFVGTFLFHHDCAPVCKARSIKTWMDELVWKNLTDLHSPELNPIKHIWDELEQRLQTSADLINLQNEWTQIPTETLPKYSEKPSKNSGSYDSCKGGDQLHIKVGVLESNAIQVPIEVMVRHPNNFCPYSVCRVFVPSRKLIWILLNPFCMNFIVAPCKPQ